MCTVTRDIVHFQYEFTYTTHETFNSYHYHDGRLLQSARSSGNVILLPYTHLPSFLDFDNFCLPSLLLLGKTYISTQDSLNAAISKLIYYSIDYS